MSRAQELREALEAGQELTIVCHKNHGPDCLASALAAVEPEKPAPRIGTEERPDIPASGERFLPDPAARVTVMQNVVPKLSTVCTHLAFVALFRVRVVTASLLATKPRWDWPGPAAGYSQRFAR
jgi:hypothetical protein